MDAPFQTPSTFLASSVHGIMNSTSEEVKTRLANEIDGDFKNGCEMRQIGSEGARKLSTYLPGKLP
jgi:hypothetical protein